MKTFEPFFRYCSAMRHRFSLKMTTRCHSVFSLRSPVLLSFQDSDVARRRLAIGRPSWVRRISGSAPRLPIRITLLTLPAMTLLRSLACPPNLAGCQSCCPQVLLPTSLAAYQPLAHQVQLNRDADNAGYTHPGKNHRRYPHQSRAAAAMPGVCSLSVLVSLRRERKGAGR